MQRSPLFVRVYSIPTRTMSLTNSIDRLCTVLRSDLAIHGTIFCFPCFLLLLLCVCVSVLFFFCVREVRAFVYVVTTRSRMNRPTCTTVWG